MKAKDKFLIQNTVKNKSELSNIKPHFVLSNTNKKVLYDAITAYENVGHYSCEDVKEKEGVFYIIMHPKRVSAEKLKGKTYSMTVIDEYLYED